MNRAVRSIGCWLIVGLLVVACGRKEPPQLIREQSAPPSIVSMTHEQHYNSIKVMMQMAGGGGFLGYQIDRAQIDPICHCPSEWRRDYEFQPRKGMDQKKVMRLITLHKTGVKFLYRIRAVDALGRLGAWSKTIDAKVVVKR